MPKNENLTKKERLIIVSNRLPITVEEKRGGLVFHQSIGGLATIMETIHGRGESIWIGWPGATFKGKPTQIETELVRNHRCYPVFLSESDVERFYHGFCNDALWPLFHSFPRLIKTEASHWRAYMDVNRLFCDKVLEVARETDIIWIHDYHLMLLPKYIREKLPNATISFFLHVPFPPFDIFSLLPWDREILGGILHAELIGFHTYGYARNFLTSVLGLFGTDNQLGEVIFKDRIVHIATFPMGIDFKKFNDVGKEKRQKAKELRKEYGDSKIILSIGRLDYIKGIVELLDAFSVFLEKYHEMHEKVSLILCVVPSRLRTKEYHTLKKEIDETVGRINGQFGRLHWIPIRYFYRVFSFNQLIEFYSIADIAVFPSLRDGLNLMAKEYVATKGEESGVLVVSEFAGVSKELVEAIIVNPKDRDSFSETFKRALNMPLEEQQGRLRAMRKRLMHYDARRWNEDFLASLNNVRKRQQQFEMKMLSESNEMELIEHYRNSKRRLLFLDYDGTLLSFVEEPKEAVPSEEILNVLSQLCNDNRNTVVIISGRDKATMHNWFGKLRVDLVAEHGIWTKEEGSDWKEFGVFSADWKMKIRPLLELYTDRCPGAFIEEKDFSIAWHYRKSDPLLSTTMANEMQLELTHLTANMDVNILSGNKVVEVRPSGTNKGKVASSWISRGKQDFILAAGDDATDEELFSVLPDYAYSIKVGFGASNAKFNMDRPQTMVELLIKLTTKKG